MTNVVESWIWKVCHRPYASYSKYAGALAATASAINA
jgi:hypothetical protein